MKSTKKTATSSKATKKVSPKVAAKKAKVTKNDLISMNILVDSSGSMYSIADDMAGSLNQLVKANRNKNVLVTYSIFSNEYQPVFADKPIKKVKDFTLEPDASTALLESACKMIDEVEARLEAKPKKERPEKVMFVIVTDGMENASQPRYSRALLKEKIKYQTKANHWVFLYFGANQDAIQEGKSFGISADRALTWQASAQGTRRNAVRFERTLEALDSAESIVEIDNVGFDEEDRKE